MLKKIISYNFLLMLLISLCSCPFAHDPPLKGYSITFHNQTNTDLFVATDTTKFDKAYDSTMLVNNKKYIERVGKYISDFSHFDYFITKTESDSIKKLSPHISFYIKKIGLPNSTTIKYNIPFNSIESKGLNHVFIYKDSITFSNKFEMTTFSKSKKATN